MFDDFFRFVGNLIAMPFIGIFYVGYGVALGTGYVLERAYNLITSLNAPRTNLLSYAVRNDYPRLAKAALYLGADPNTADSGSTIGNTLLHTTRSVAMATALKDAGARLDRNAEGNTPLHLAVNKPDAAQLCDLFIGMNADVNQANNEGFTPLHLACSAQPARLDVVRLLLSKGANPNLQTLERNTTPATGKDTPLHLFLRALGQSLRNGHSLTSAAVDVAKLLITAGARLETKNQVGKNVLDEFADLLETSYSRSTATSAALDKLAFALLQPHLVQPVAEQESTTLINGSFKLLHFIAKKCVAAAFDLLSPTSRDRDINTADTTRNTPLSYAAAAGNLEMVNKLLANGAVGIPHAFHAAAHSDTANQEQIMQVLHAKAPAALLDHASARKFLHIPDNTQQASPSDWYRVAGDNSNVANRATMLHFAAQYLPAQEVKKFLPVIKKSARDDHGRTPLHYAVSSGNLDAVMALLEAGADVNATDTYGLPPLYYAAHVKDRHDVLRALISANANINMEIADQNCVHSGRSLLHYAAQYGSSLAVKTLIDYGANPNAKDTMYFMPYEPVTEQTGSQAGNTATTNDGTNRIAHRLTAPRTEAPFNANEHSGRTPLHYAVMGSNVANVRTLLQVQERVPVPASSAVPANRDPFSLTPLMCLADDQGYLPQHYAAAAKNREILSLLPAVPLSMPTPYKDLHAQRQRAEEIRQEVENARTQNTQSAFTAPTTRSSRFDSN